jgi:uncharacterized protein (DUF849 family)
MKRTADRLFGNQYQWSVLGAGASQMQLASLGAMLGGNVRVGLEDSLFIERGQLAESNAQQVAKVRRLVEELGFDIATPDDVREMLDLKGADKVNF